MQMRRMGALLSEPMMVAYRPAADHGVGDFGMELQTVGDSITKRLSLEFLSFGEQGRPARQIEPLAVPLIDMVGKVLLAAAAAGLGRPDRMIADLDSAFGVPVDAVAEMAGECAFAPPRQMPRNGFCSLSKGTPIQSISRRM